MLDKLKEDLIKELEDFERKGISVNNLSVVDTLAHAAKNVCKIQEACEGGSSERSYRSWRSSREGSSREGSSREGSYDYEYGGESRRGRDAMGRYTSRHGGMVEKLEELMDEAPDEQTRRELQKMIQKMER